MNDNEAMAYFCELLADPLRHPFTLMPWAPLSGYCRSCKLGMMRHNVGLHMEPRPEMVMFLEDVGR